MKRNSLFYVHFFFSKLVSILFKLEKKKFSEIITNKFSTPSPIRWFRRICGMVKWMHLYYKSVCALMFFNAHKKCMNTYIYVYGELVHFLHVLWVICVWNSHTITKLPLLIACIFFITHTHILNTNIVKSMCECV